MLMWGELAAWRISAQLADRLEPLEMKMAATSQAHDEARHFYVMHDYLELATGGLKELPVEELPLYRSWCLVQAKAKRLSPVAHAFLGFIRSERVQISVLAERFAGQPRAPASAAPDSR